MNKVKIPAYEKMPDQNKRILDEIKMAFGFIPNVFAYMAYSPVALKSYLHYTREKTCLTDQEAEAVFLVTSQVNACDYCLSAHSVLAKAAGLTDEQILELRQGQASFNKKMDALVKLTQEIVLHRGKVGAEYLAGFCAVGYTNQHLVDVVLLISQVTVTNYVNNITHNAIDFPEAPPI